MFSLSSTATSLSSGISSGESGTGAYFLGNLLPEELFCPPNDAIGIRLLICQRALESLNIFKNKQMASLDGAMGDQACQIRALQFCLLSREGLKIPLKQARAAIRQCSNELAAIQKKSAALLAKSQNKVSIIREMELEPLKKRNEKIDQERQQALEPIPRGDPRAKSINAEFGRRFATNNKEKGPIEQKIAFLENRYLEKQTQMISALSDPIVDPSVLLLTRAYMVCLIKVECIEKSESGGFIFQEHMNVKQLQTGASMTFNTQLLQKTIDKAKQIICKESILFTQQQAEVLTCENAPMLKQILASPRLIPEKKREELPFFYLTRVIFERALQEKLPVILKVRPETSRPLVESSYCYRILFKANYGAYQVREAEEEDLNCCAIVIESISRIANKNLAQSAYVEALLAEDRELLDIIDLNAAQHTQYTDQKVSISKMFDQISFLEPLEKERVVSLMIKAFREGFSSTLAKVCCIDHIFCDLLKNQIGAEVKT